MTTHTLVTLSQPLDVSGVYVPARFEVRKNELQALLTAIKDRLCMAITDHEKLLRIDELIRKAVV
jgi:hypothetical protein